MLIYVRPPICNYNVEAAKRKSDVIPHKIVDDGILWIPIRKLILIFKVSHAKGLISYLKGHLLAVKLDKKWVF